MSLYNNPTKMTYSKNSTLIFEFGGKICTRSANRDETVVGIGKEINSSGVQYTTDSIVPYVRLIFYKPELSHPRQRDRNRRTASRSPRSEEINAITTDSS
jgi:hypothetical protein